MYLSNYRPWRNKKNQHCMVDCRRPLPETWKLMTICNKTIYKKTNFTDWTISQWWIFTHIAAAYRHHSYFVLFCQIILEIEVWRVLVISFFKDVVQSHTVYIVDMNGALLLASVGYLHKLVWHTGNHRAVVVLFRALFGMYQRHCSRSFSQDINRYVNCCGTCSFSFLVWNVCHFGAFYIWLCGMGDLKLLISVSFWSLVESCLISNHTTCSFFYLSVTATSEINLLIF